MRVRKTKFPIVSHNKSHLQQIGPDSSRPCQHQCRTRLRLQDLARQSAVSSNHTFLQSPCSPFMSCIALVTVLQLLPTLAHSLPPSLPLVKLRISTSEMSSVSPSLFYYLSMLTRPLADRWYTFPCWPYKRERTSRKWFWRRLSRHTGPIPCDQPWCYPSSQQGPFLQQPRL
jgi:hypothetical protein